jgi:arylsulfatase
VHQQKALMPDKPFFMYFAPGATHAPPPRSPEWADKYAGQFDDGWDVPAGAHVRAQKDLGVVPAEADLTERPRSDPGVGDMPDELKPVPRAPDGGLRRVLEHTDHHVGPA